MLQTFSLQGREKNKKEDKIKEQEWELINNLYSRVKKSRKLRVKAS